MSPGLDPKHVPKAWRPTYALALLVGVVLSAGGVAYGVVRGVAHHVAREVVNDRWDESFRAQVTEIATAAAVTASRDAVAQIAREQVGPLKEKVDQHIPKDDDRVARLQTDIDRCCPRWTPTRGN